MVDDEIQTVKKPRIISFDLEVSPALGYFYPPTWETRVLKAVHRQKLMSFAWQIVGEKKIHARNLSQMDTYKVDPQNDKLLVMELHKILSTADILLGQNSDKFDVRMANYFFLLCDLEPIPPVKYIDTKKIASRYFKFMNNTLDNLGEEMGYGGKTEITYANLWVPAFLEGDKKSWKLMDIYCKNDVDQTTKIYLKMRGFMHQHPSLSRISGEESSCPRCGGYDFRIKAYRTTNTSRYHQYQCNNCNGFFSDRKAITEREGDVKPSYINV